MGSISISVWIFFGVLIVFGQTQDFESNFLTRSLDGDRSPKTFLGWIFGMDGADRKNDTIINVQSGSSNRNISVNSTYTDNRNLSDSSNSTKNDSRSGRQLFPIRNRLPLLHPIIPNQAPFPISPGPVQLPILPPVPVYNMYWNINANQKIPVNDSEAYDYDDVEVTTRISSDDVDITTDYENSVEDGFATPDDYDDSISLQNPNPYLPWLSPILPINFGRTKLDLNGTVCNSSNCTGTLPNIGNRKKSPVSQKQETETTAVLNPVETTTPVTEIFTSVEELEPFDPGASSSTTEPNFPVDPVSSSTTEQSIPEFTDPPQPDPDLPPVDPSQPDPDFPPVDPTESVILPDETTLPPIIDESEIPNPGTTETVVLPEFPNTELPPDVIDPPVTGDPEFPTDTPISETEITTTRPMKPPPPFHDVLPCQCGVQSVVAQPIGSSVVRVKTTPWLVAIFKRRKLLCAGTLISDRYVLTTANCVRRVRNKTDLTVIIGLQSKSPSTHSVYKISIHPKYDVATSSNNVALLGFRFPISPGPNARPVCLPFTKGSEGYNTGNISTWIFNMGRLSVIQSEVQLLNKTFCETGLNKSGSSRKVLGSGSFCAEPPAQKICQGRRGGSLHAYVGRNSYEQIGVVGWGVGCKSSGMPGVYSSIRPYIRWILFKVQDGLFCKESKSRKVDFSFLDLENQI